jgi:hypothetical protein
MDELGAMNRKRAELPDSVNIIDRSGWSYD